MPVRVWGDLPFAAESFDIIVMNGVLEWVGKTKHFSRPREAQIACLKICRQLLKAQGYLYIGIENRWAASYLRGRDHSGLRFTSYMPRWLADWYSRLRGKGSYATYTYSRRGYDRLLSDAGFATDKIEYYLPYPGYNHPRIVIPYGRLSILRYVITSMLPAPNFRRRLIQCLARYALFLKLYRLFFFSYNIIARK